MTGEICDCAFVLMVKSEESCKLFKPFKPFNTCRAREEKRGAT